MSETTQYDRLKLENQLCFPLYACSKEIIRQYKPFLDEIDLTYTQYIAMMVLWEEKEVNVTHLGDRLFLDSGTLTPLLKKLEGKGLVERKRSCEDERVMNVSITEKGMKLRDEAVKIPDKMGACMDLTPQQAVQLYTVLYDILHKFVDAEK